MDKFKTLRQPLLRFWIVVFSGRLYSNKNVMKIVATFVYAISQGQRTHSARANYEQIMSYEWYTIKQNVELSFKSL